MSADFTRVPAVQLERLVRETPLCWIVPRADPACAILMPVVLQGTFDAGARLLGHLPKAAPATGALMAAPHASFLFLGPNAYISPDMAGRDNWAPTWNFVSLKLSGRVTMSERLTRSGVEAIVKQMEGAEGWSIEHLGERAGDLLARIIGFTAEIDDIQPRFKLGQDENPEVAASISKRLTNDPLAAWVDPA